MHYYVFWLKVTAGYSFSPFLLLFIRSLCPPLFPCYLIPCSFPLLNHSTPSSSLIASFPSPSLFSTLSWVPCVMSLLTPRMAPLWPVVRSHWRLWCMPMCWTWLWQSVQMHDYTIVPKSMHRPKNVFSKLTAGFLSLQQWVLYQLRHRDTWELWHIKCTHPWVHYALGSQHFLYYNAPTLMC